MTFLLRLRIAHRYATAASYTFDTEDEAEMARATRYHPDSWEVVPTPGSADDRPITYRRERI